MVGIIVIPAIIFVVTVVGYNLGQELEPYIPPEIKDIILPNFLIKPISAVSNTLDNLTILLNEIINFSLYNFIFPILVLIFAGLFFIIQFYLIKFYIKLFMGIRDNFPKIFNYIKNTVFHVDEIKDYDKDTSIHD